MNSMKKNLNRREAFTLGATGLISVGVGANLLGSLMPRVGMMGNIGRALTSGESFAYGDTLAGAEVYQIVLCAKLTECLMIYLQNADPATAGTSMVGFEGKTGNAMAPDVMYNGVSIAGKAQTATNFRGIPFTSLFGDALVAGLPANYNVALLPQCSSMQGGHSLANSHISMELGGINSALQMKAPGNAQGVLGPIGFYSTGTVSTRDAFVGPNRLPMDTNGYDSVANLRSTVKNGAASIQVGKGRDFQSNLNRFAMKDSKRILEALDAIKTSADQAMVPLADAMALPDAGKQQAAAVVALAKANLANSYSLAITTSDTNGGGNSTNAGGDMRLSPHQAAAMLSEMIVNIAKARPNAIITINSDGGRAANGGDSPGMPVLVVAPNTLINHGVFGKLADFADLGSTGAQNTKGFDIIMSDNSKMKTLTPMHWLSLVAILSQGVVTGVPYPVATKDPNKADVDWISPKLRV